MYYSSQELLQKSNTSLLELNIQYFVPWYNGIYMYTINLSQSRRYQNVLCGPITISQVEKDQKMRQSGLKNSVDLNEARMSDSCKTLVYQVIIRVEHEEYELQVATL